MTFKIGFVLLAFASFGITACHKKVKQENGYTVLKGKFLKDKYEIAYDSTIDLSVAIDSIVQSEVGCLSNNSKNSLIYRFNNGLTYPDSSSYNREKPVLEQFDSLNNFLLHATKGRYNAGLAALEAYWLKVFEDNDRTEWNPIFTDSLKTLSFGTKVEFIEEKGAKPDPRMAVWMDESLPGILADKLAWTLENTYKIKNFYLNFGGEIRVKGNNGTDSYWPIKIEKPMINTLKKIEYASVPLKNYALSTKDNFNKLHFIKGKRYSLTLDALKGFPAKNELLSVTIMAPNALEASSYASACLSIGLEASKKLLSDKPYLKAFIIFEKEGSIEHWATNNFSFTLNTKE